MMLGAATVVLKWRMEQEARGRDLEARIQQVRLQRLQHQELARELQGLEHGGRSMERRIRAIERLRALQARPVRILDLLSQCVQEVPGLRLQELSRKNGTFSLRGLVSGDSSRVSEFMAGLQRTGEFHRVELIHFQEENGHYAFALSFEGSATGRQPQNHSPRARGD
jgi:Tfp pilus assembly protein PilN